jgi:hypothetical protein
VKPGREGPTIPVQLRGGLRSPNRTVTPTGSTIIRMAGGAVCIYNAPNTSSMAMSSPPRGLHSRHTGSHYIDDPPNMRLYIQQDNIRLYHTICKCTNNIREVIG